MVSFIFILPTWLPTYEYKNIGKILKYLQTNNFKVTIYCGPTEYKEDFHNAFPEIKLNTKRTIYRWPNLIGHLRQVVYLALVLKKYEGTIRIVWTYAGYRENLWLVFMRRLLGLRIIIKNDSRILSDKNSQWGRLRDWLVYILPAKKSDGIISETPEVFANWSEFSVQPKRHIIYSNGADISTLRAIRGIFDKNNNIDKEKYILVSGRLNQEKGVDLAVEAFCKLASLYPQWRMILVGEIYVDEAYLKACKLAEEYGLKERITWKSFCKGRELYEIYHKCAIFLNTSRNEGLPNRFIEAMFFKCAVLSFDVGQCKYLLSDNRGVVVENGNLKLFVQELMGLMESRALRDNYGRKASLFIENEFNDEINLPILTQWMIGSTDIRDTSQ
jgi:glycosyltransferase involved in cell wall biosynthesis